jgi:hypothetical protein
VPGLKTRDPISKLSNGGTSVLPFFLTRRMLPHKKSKNSP